MFWYTFKVAIISLLIILLSHHLLEILKKSLTNEKIIDCVKKPQKEYEKIYEILVNENNSNNLTKEKKVSFEEDDEAILTRHLLDETI
jgi:ABC-type multidrug transport system fused ATPase/permease subunit